MNKLDELIKQVQDELDGIRRQYELVNQLKDENKIEQDKIVEQNINIKNRIDELKTSQARIDKKQQDLDEREKQILIKEKSLIASNRLLDEKLLDFRKRTSEINTQENRLKKDLEDYHARKILVDQQALINQKMEETEALRKKKIKVKEEQVDRELARLRDMQV